MRRICYRVMLLACVIYMVASSPLYASSYDYILRGVGRFMIPTGNEKIFNNGIQVGEFDGSTDATYAGFGVDGVLFFTDYISTQMSVGYTRSTSNFFVVNTNTGSARPEEGKITLIPVELYFNYHFAPWGEITPYIGIGAHYTFAQHSISSIKSDDAAGFAMQLGADWWFKDEYAFNFTLRAFLMQTEEDYSELNGPGQYTEVEYNPIEISVGLSKRF